MELATLITAFTCYLIAIVKVLFPERWVGTRLRSHQILRFSALILLAIKHLLKLCKLQKYWKIFQTKIEGSKYIVEICSLASEFVLHTLLTKRLFG